MKKGTIFISFALLVSFLSLFLLIRNCSGDFVKKKERILPEIVSETQSMQFNSLLHEDKLSGEWTGPKRKKEYFIELNGKTGEIKFDFPEKRSIVIEIKLNSGKSDLITFYLNGLLLKRVHITENLTKKIVLPVKKQKVNSGENRLRIFRKSINSKLKIFGVNIISKIYYREFSKTDDLHLKKIGLPAQLTYYFWPGKDKFHLTFNKSIKDISVVLSDYQKVLKVFREKKRKEMSLNLSRWGGRIIKAEIKLNDSNKIVELQESFLKKSMKISKDNRKIIRKNLKKLTKKYNVLLMLLDSARADHFSYMGYKRDVTPNIDKIARSSIVFKKYYAEAAFTLASTASLLSGLPPDYHNVIRLFSGGLNSEIETIAEMFQENGFYTAAVSSIPFFGSVYNMDQGFDDFIELFKKRDQVMAPELFDPLRKIVKKSRNLNRNFFAYLHFREPHISYLMPPPFFGKFHKGFISFPNPDFRRRLKDIYFKRGEYKKGNYRDVDIELLRDSFDENLASSDDIVGKITDFLKKTGIFDNTIIIITADHGEALYNHKFIGHNIVLYREGMQIPLIIRIPGITEGGGVNSSNLSTTDLTKTLTILFDKKVKKNDLNSHGLFSAFDRKLLIGRTISFPNFKANYVLMEGNFRCLIKFNKKIETELYDLDIDPGEKNRIINPFIENYFKFRLKNFLKLKFDSSIKSEKVEVNRDIRKKLKSLGYL